MKLLSQLNEASDLPLASLKKSMLKDGRIKGIFAKSLALDDIQNKQDFLETIKFFFLNNRNVLEFVNSRDQVKNLDKRILKSLRKLTAEALTEDSLEELREFVWHFFQEVGQAEKSTLSAGVKKELLDWVNANGRYFNLSSYAQKELQSLPNIRPTKPIRLYRGLLFSSGSLKEIRRYDGTLDLGKGLKFLKAIRAGTRIVDLEWDRASSWTTSRETALQFAQFGPASSNFTATLQWLTRKDAIDGDLGFLISTLAQPEDILIDISRTLSSAKLKHGDEAEFILKPGSYTCRVATKFSRAGEEDPVATKTSSKTIDALQAVLKFAQSWTKNKVFKLDFANDNSRLDLSAFLSRDNFDGFKTAIDKKTKEASLSAQEELLELYKNYIKDLSEAELQSVLTDESLGKVASWIIEFSKSMSRKQRSPAFKSDKNPRGEAPKGEMSASQIRDLGSTPLATTLKSTLKLGKAKFTDSGISHTLSPLSIFLKDETNIRELHRKSKENQQRVVEAIIAGFFEKLGLSQPSSQEEAVDKMCQVFLAGERNLELIGYLRMVKRDLTSLLEDSAD